MHWAIRPYNYIGGRPVPGVIIKSLKLIQCFVLFQLTYIVIRIISFGMYRDMYHIVTPVYRFTPTVCICIAYLLLSIISSLLCPHYCAGIHEVAPLRLSNGIHEREPRPLFLTPSGHFWLWNCMYSSQEHLASLEYNSYHNKSLLIGGIRWYLVAFAI